VQRIFIARNVTEAHIVSGMLNAAGIRAEVRGHYLASGYGELPISNDTLPSVWIEDAAQTANARTLIAEYERPAPGKGPPWRCEQCGEIHAVQFTACWKCGREKRLA
jgi:Putative prokaryotic signal transducing protein